MKTRKAKQVYPCVLCGEESKGYKGRSERSEGQMKRNFQERISTKTCHLLGAAQTALGGPRPAEGSSWAGEGSPGPRGVDRLLGTLVLSVGRGTRSHHYRFPSLRQSRTASLVAGSGCVLGSLRRVPRLCPQEESGGRPWVSERKGNTKSGRPWDVGRRGSSCPLQRRSSILRGVPSAPRQSRSTS